MAGLKQIGHLEAPMEDACPVEVGDTLQQLAHDLIDTVLVEKLLYVLQNDLKSCSTYSITI